MLTRYEWLHIFQDRMGLKVALVNLDLNIFPGIVYILLGKMPEVVRNFGP